MVTVSEVLRRVATPESASWFIRRYATLPRHGYFVRSLLDSLRIADAAGLFPQAPLDLVIVQLLFRPIVPLFTGSLVPL